MGTWEMFKEALKTAFAEFVESLAGCENSEVLTKNFVDSATELAKYVREAMKHGIFPVSYRGYGLVYVHVDGEDVTITVSVDTRMCNEPVACLSSDYRFRVQSEDTWFYVTGGCDSFDKWRKIIDIAR